MIKYGVYIGRFQPFHVGHISCINQVLDKIDKLIIFIGVTVGGERTTKDPFTFIERRNFIKESLDIQPIILPVSDYNDIVKWSDKIKEIVRNIVEDNKVYLLNYKKDQSTYYVDYFKEFEHIMLKQIIDINATDIRNLYYRDDEYKNNIMLPVIEFMEGFKNSEYFDELKYKYIVLE